MKKGITLIGVISFIFFGLGLFAAPAFAASIHNVSEVVTSNNSSELMFIGTALGLFGAAVGLI